VRSPEVRSRPVTQWLSCAGAAALGGGLYINALHNPFVYDDFRTVVDNGSIASLRDISAIVLHDATRPLTNFSLAIDRAVWGVAPFGYHVTNLLLHVLNVVLVFMITSHLCDDTREDGRGGHDTRTIGVTAAFVAAALFASHPMMTEAVGYISSRADLLCASLFLLAFLAARWWLLHGGAIAYFGTWLLWAAALLSKETAALFPVVLLVYRAFIRRPASAHNRPAAVLLGPLLAVMAVAAALRLIVFSQLEHARIGSGWTAFAITANAFWDYARLLLNPVGQTIFHPNTPVSGAGDVRLWISLALLIGAVALGRWGRTRVPIVVFAGVWFALLLAPAALPGLTEAGSAVAEHRAYLPAVGFVLMVGGLVRKLLPLIGSFRSTRILGPLALASMLLMLSGRTYMRNLVWADPVNLWEEASTLAPGHWLPLAVLGESLHAAGRHNEAVQAYRESLTLRADNEPAAINLIVCLSELSRAQEASAVVATLEQLGPNAAYAPIGRGAIAAIAGRHDEARKQFLEALARDRTNVIARQWLALLAEESGSQAEALHRCYELQRLAPGRASIDDCIARARPHERAATR